MFVRTRWLAVAVVAGVLWGACGSSSDDEEDQSGIGTQDGGTTADASVPVPDGGEVPDAGPGLSCRPSETECTGTFGSACCGAAFQCNGGACVALSPPEGAVLRNFPGVAADADGRIYVVGGGDASEENAVEVFDSTNNTWSRVAPLPETASASFTSAASGNDGRVYAFAGDTGLVYDPGSDSWSELPALPTARQTPALAAGADGRIYAIGGFSPTRNRPVADVDVFDPAAGTWTTVASMNTGRVRLAAATGPDGRIYAVGGTSETTVTAAVEVFDPAANTWTAAAEMPTARSELAAAFGPDGRLYAIGGFDGSVGLATVEAFDPAGGAWSEAPALPLARAGAAAATGPGPNGLIYVSGGGAATLEAFSTERGSWQ